MKKIKIITIYLFLVNNSYAQNQYEFVSYSTNGKDLAAYGSAVQSADLDGDGDFDVALLYPDYDRIYWLENDGNFSFTEHILTGCSSMSEERGLCNSTQTFYSLDYPRNLAIGKLGLPGYGDSLVVFAMDQYNLQGFKLIKDPQLNSQSPVFKFQLAKQRYDGWLQRLYIDDVDKDGIDDIFYTTDQNLSNYISGNNPKIGAIPGTPGSRAFRLYDFDKDGDLDWIDSFQSTNPGWLTLGMWKNNGDFTFSSNRDTLLNGNLKQYQGQSFDLADIDGDGDTDIVFGKIKWAENINNKFTLHDIGSVQEVNYLEIVDADEDGDQDVVVAGYYSIWLFTNDGSSPPSFDIDSLGKGQHFDLLDFDKDGDIDIVSSNGWYKYDSKLTGFNWLEKGNTPILININKNNLNDFFTIKWSSSIDRDSQNETKYKLFLDDKLHALISDTTYQIKHQTFFDSLSNYPNKFNKTFKYDVWAYSGSDSNKIKEPLLINVNAFGYYLYTDSETIPTDYNLHENYPNPFNPITQIRFDLPEVSNTTLTIYNMIGQKIRTFNMQNAPAGYHTLTWNATNDLGVQVSAGVYLYQLQTQGFVKTKKMILLK